MTDARVFLACELPAALQDAIWMATAGLHRALGDDLIRWVPSHNVHLTLKFLGDVSPSNLEPIRAVLAGAAAQCRAFDVRVGGLGCYPNARRPRVLWTALDAPVDLTRLQHNLDVATAGLGYSSEERQFSPHLTIGRVRQHTSVPDLQRISGALGQIRLADIGSARLEEIHLFRSDLQAGGPTYTKLFSARLGTA